jgi:type IV pilus assembly protein PilB
VLSSDTAQKIEQIIIDNKLVDDGVLRVAKEQANSMGKTLIEVLVERKAITDEDSTKLIALTSGTPYVDLKSREIDQKVLKLLPRDVASTYMAVPFAMNGAKLQVAMVDPSNLQAVDFIARKTGYSLETFMATKQQVDAVLGNYTEGLGAEVAQVLDRAATTQQAATDAQAEKKSFKDSAKEVENLVQDAPITRALNAILEYAINSKASDIHIEPREQDLKIRFRIDGILQDAMTLPKTTEPPLISRIKILSNLKIDEHRIPQDGQAQYKVADREVDLRIAIAPITYGEQVVMRILDKSESLMTLDSLGFRGRSLRLIEQGMKKPHGMILSTGPTGSGKSTTLYAVIQEIKDVSINIVTLEDPVEYKMDGINQIQVNSAVGLTFASGLRSILRQDPNVIMVGEIRDHETADLAVQASLTGHVVLSTLHTNSASGVLPRMLDMDIEPFLIASTINTVIGQRLVRKVCENCKKPVESTEAATQMINRALSAVLPKSESEAAAKAEELGYDNLPIYNEKAYTLYKGEGCSQCADGYKGRTGIYEVFEMNTAMEKLLLSHATTADIQKQAQADGMLTMQQDGILKVLMGVTTIEEVSRVASDY